MELVTLGYTLSLGNGELDLYSFIKLSEENFYNYLREEAPQAIGMQVNYGSRVSKVFFTVDIETI